MRASEIRETTATSLRALDKEDTPDTVRVTCATLTVALLAEVAAQLADLNENLTSIKQVPVKFDVQIAPGNTSGHFDARTR